MESITDIVERLSARIAPLATAPHPAAVQWPDNLEDCIRFAAKRPAAPKPKLTPHEQMRDAWKNSGLTQGAFAEKLGVSLATVNGWIAVANNAKRRCKDGPGTKPPSAEMLYRACNIDP